MRSSSEISIYRPGSPATVVQTVPITPASRRVWKLMDEDSITLSFNLAVSVDFQVGDYIDDEVFGHFTISEDPLPADYEPTTGAYKYELRFDADWVCWKNKVFMLTYGTGTQADPYVRKDTTWDLTDTLDNHLSVVLQNLTALGITGYSKFVDTTTVPDPAKAVHITYSGTSILDALKALADAYECEFWVEDKVIHFGKCETGSVIDFSMTDDDSRTINVENIVPSRADNEYGNRFWVYGSTKNIPETYRKHLTFKVSDWSGHPYPMFKDTTRVVDASMLTRRLVNRASPITSQYAGAWNTEGYSQNTYEDVDPHGQTITVHYMAAQFASAKIEVTDGSTISIDLGSPATDWHYTYYIYSDSGTLITSGTSNLSNYSIPSGVESVVVKYSYEYESEWANNPPGAPTVTYTLTKEWAYYATVSSGGSTAKVRLIEGNWFIFVQTEPATYYTSSPISGFGLNSEFTLNFSTNGGDGLRYSYVPYSYYSDNDVKRMVGERRLMLPEGTDYIQTDNTLTQEQIVERVVYFEEIYPKCALRITSVDVSDYDATTTYSDGSKTAASLPAYTLQAKLIVYQGTDTDFPFDPNTMMSSGQKLQATFLTPDETKKYSGLTTENACSLMGMTFDVACNRASGITTYQLAWNSDYGDKLPNDVLMPRVGDAFILSGWNPVAMGSLAIISSAETTLQTTATTYANLVKEAQFTFDCAMMSDWIVENMGTIQEGELPCKKLLPMGQKVKVWHGALAAGYLVSRIIGFEYKLDIPYDTPIYTVGETDAYSRLKEIEKSLHAQSQSSTASSNTGSSNMSGTNPTTSTGGGNQPLHLVPGTMVGMSSVDYDGSEEKTMRVPSVVDNLADGDKIPRIADDGNGGSILVDKEGNEVAGKQFFEIYEDTSTTPHTFSVKLKDTIDGKTIAGLWANGFGSFGGIGSGGGGGGGGSSYLSDLLDVGISSPSDGDILMYDHTQRKPWVNVPQSSISPDLSAYGHSLTLTGNVGSYLKDSNDNFLLDSNGNFLATTPSASINLLNASGTVISSVAIPTTVVSSMDFVTLTGAQTISGAKTFSADITLYGSDLVPAEAGSSNIGSDDYYFGSASIQELYVQEISDFGNSGLQIDPPTYIDNTLEICEDDYIKIGGSYLGWDNTNKRLKVYGTYTQSSTTKNIGLHCDGPITSSEEQTANYVLAAPNGSNGTASFRALVANDIPDLSTTYKTVASLILKGTETLPVYFNSSGEAATITGLSVSGNIATTGGTLTVARAITLSSTSSPSDATRRIYFENSNHYIELKNFGGGSYAFHFSDPIYSDSWVAAGGVGSSGGGSGTYYAGTGLSLSDTTFSLKVAANNEIGGLKVYSVISTPTVNTPSTTSGKYYYVQCDSNGLAFVNVPWSGGGGGGGSVTSVALTMPSCFSVSGSPVESSGTLAVTFTSQTANYVLAAPSSAAGTPSFRALDVSDIPSLSSLYLPLSGGTMTGPITMNGANILSSADSANQIGSVTNRFGSGYFRNLYTTYFGFRSGDNSSQWGNISMGDGLAQIILNTSPDNCVYTFNAAYGFFHGGNGAVPSGRDDHRWSTVWGVNANFSGVVTVNGLNTIDQSNASMSLFNYGARTSKSFNAYGTSFNLRVINSSDQQVNMLAVNSSGALFSSGIFPADGVTGLAIGNSTSRWGDIYCTNGNLSGDLTLASTSHIDLGPVRLEYDSGNTALHVTTNDSTNHPTIGFWVDGFNSAGGVGSNSGGGGGGSTVTWGTASNNTIPLTVDGDSETLLLASAKVTSISSSSTDYQVPSAKCIYDGLATKQKNITVSSSEPTSGDGENGDIWIVI